MRKKPFILIFKLAM